MRAVEARRTADPAFGDAIAAAQVIREAGAKPALAWDLDNVWRGVVRPDRCRKGSCEGSAFLGNRRAAISIPQWGRLAAAALVVAAAAVTWESRRTP